MMLRIFDSKDNERMQLKCGGVIKMLDREDMLNRESFVEKLINID